MNILIIKLGAIGDIVHTLPALAEARSAKPNASISWVAEARSAEILRGNHLIDNLIEIDTRGLRGTSPEKLLPELSRQVGMLRKFDFDLAIDFQGLIKSAVVGKISGSRKRWGFSKPDLREPAARFLYTDTVEIPANTHIIQKNLALCAKALNLESSNSHLRFPIFSDETHRKEAAAIVQNAANGYVILNPAGGWPTKLWPAANFGMLADEIWAKYGLMSIITTGPNEAPLANVAVRSSRSGKAIAVQPSIKAFFELAKNARLYVGGDTGPTHIAAAAGTPIVGIFGPTEWWRNGSINLDDICVERLDIGCRVDCHRRSCSNWICMEIDVATVMKGVDSRLSLSARSRMEGPDAQKTIDVRRI